MELRAVAKSNQVSQDDDNDGSEGCLGEGSSYVLEGGGDRRSAAFGGGNKVAANTPPPPLSSSPSLYPSSSSSLLPPSSLPRLSPIYTLSGPLNPLPPTGAAPKPKSIRHSCL